MVFGERWLMMKGVLCDHVTLHNYLRRASLTFKKMEDVTFEVLIIELIP